MQERHYLQLISETSIDRDMQLRSGFGKMAKRLILLLCPCTWLNKNSKTQASEEPTCLNIEGIVSVELFNHEWLIFWNIQPDPERLLKVREGAICIMGCQSARVFWW